METAHTATEYERDCVVEGEEEEAVAVARSSVAGETWVQTGRYRSWAVSGRLWAAAVEGEVVDAAVDGPAANAAKAEALRATAPACYALEDREESPGVVRAHFLSSSGGDCSDGVCVLRDLASYRHHHHHHHLAIRGANRLVGKEDAPVTVAVAKAGQGTDPPHGSGCWGMDS